MREGGGGLVSVVARGRQKARIKVDKGGQRSKVKGQRCSQVQTGSPVVRIRQAFCEKSILIIGHSVWPFSLQISALTDDG